MEPTIMPSAGTPAKGEYNAPIPVLGQNYRHPDTVDPPRMWKNAPDAVRSAYTLSLLGMVLYGLFTILSVNGAIADAARFDLVALPVPTILMPFLFGTLTFLNFYLMRGHRKADKNVWRFQIGVSLVCLLMFPLGTLLHALVLVGWFRPETKAWYGIA
jgi:membrane protein insertase Oxa1/YidC/SpoIIIJ